MDTASGAAEEAGEVGESALTELGDWVIASGCVPGLHSASGGKPLQDACVVHRSSSIRGFVVVADGAGSAPLSHLGAQAAVAHLAAHFAAIPEDIESLDGMSWRATAAAGFSAVQHRLGELAKAEGVALSTLACTLIVLAYAPDAIALAHVGDGRAAYRTPAGEWRALMQPERGEEAGSTVFVTTTVGDDEWFDRHLRTTFLAHSVSAFTCMTDGCERSAFLVSVFSEALGRYHDPNLPYAPFLDPNVSTLLALQAEGVAQAEIDALWAQYLRNGDERSPTLRQQADDKTMILAARTTGASGTMPVSTRTT